VRADSQVLELACPLSLAPCTVIGAVDCEIHPSVVGIAMTASARGTGRVTRSLGLAPDFIWTIKSNLERARWGVGLG
jgi:hypothetical protein